MLRKEIKAIIKNPVYFVIIVLPLFLAFIMSEGTKSYLSQHRQISEAVNTAREIIPYNGVVLNSKAQFAVSELNFMLMMCAILAGLSLFEERRLHVWDRVVEKNKFILIKFFIHYGVSVLMIVFNIVGFWLLFDIKMSVKSIFVFLSVPLISILLGFFVGITAKGRAVLSNTILMIVMIMGYFGGALSLTSVLSNTSFMNVLMRLSPLTMANKLVFKDLIGISMGNDLLLWILLISIFAGTFIFLIGRKIKNGASI